LVNHQPDWGLGFEDETWWSRLARPHLSAWSETKQPVRLVEQVRDRNDPDPPALACYGLLVRWGLAEEAREQMWLRFVDGRPVSAITSQFLAWCCIKLEAQGKRVWVLVWDNASWHISQAVRRWLHAHNQQVKRSGQGVRILACRLPTQSPWLNPIEPKWVHGKRRVVEPNRLLSAQELADRICATFECDHVEHLSIPENVT
jgi:hypothetical protein